MSAGLGAGFRAHDAWTLHWARGGEAQVVAYVGDALSLLSTISSPPGSRIEGTFRQHSTDPVAAFSEPNSGSVAIIAHALRFKVHQCKRQEDGRFLLQGRTIDATKALREILLSEPHVAG
jgi:hypothetical protein